MKEFFIKVKNGLKAKFAPAGRAAAAVARFFKAAPRRVKTAAVATARFFRALPGMVKACAEAAPGFFKALPGNTKAFIKSAPRRARTLYAKIRKITRYDVKVFFFGRGEKKGLIPAVAVYGLAILFGFVFIYPLLYMLAYSFMSPSDVVNPTIHYLPTGLFGGNFKDAVRVINFWPTLFSTLYISGVSALLQTLAASLIAYGLARFDFPGKKLIFVLVLLTFLLPPQILMLPQQQLYKTLGILNSPLAYFFPALFGQGIKSAVFILVFYQFFRAIPKALTEAAKIDGAGALKVFVKVAVPMAVPAYLLSFLLSLVWYYNESVLNVLFLGDSKTLIGELSLFESAYNSLFPPASNTGKTVNEAIYMAGTTLCVLPLILIYLFTQRYFIQGIDKAGITGE